MRSDNEILARIEEVKALDVIVHYPMPIEASFDGLFNFYLVGFWARRRGTPIRIRFSHFHGGMIPYNDWMGTEQRDLIEALSFEAAKPFLKPETLANEWTPNRNPLGEIRDYMEFAWEKANDNRGLSAGRSLDHMRAWLWLANEEDLMRRVDKDFSHYGKPQLRLICEHFKINWREYDDGRWANDESSDGVVPEDVPNII